jgi:hypothetical protein
MIIELIDAPDAILAFFVSSLARLFFQKHNKTSNHIFFVLIQTNQERQRKFYQVVVL